MRPAIGRRAAARRGLPHPFHDPLRQGTGVEVGLSAQRRRWLHAVRSWYRNLGRDRGGTSPALRRYDQGRGRSPSGSVSSSTVSTRRAIVTSMQQGRDSFPKSCSLCLSKRLGLPVAQRDRPVRGPKWILAPECEECGGKLAMSPQIGSAPAIERSRQLADSQIEFALRISRPRISRPGNSGPGRRTLFLDIRGCAAPQIKP